MKPARVIDSLAKVVLVVAAGVVLVAIFSFLVIALRWLVIPVLLVVGAVAWLAYRGHFPSTDSTPRHPGDHRP